MIDKDAIYNKIVQVVRDELLCEGDFTPDTEIATLGLDSIQTMQLFVYLEESFEFEFAEESLIEKMRTGTLGELVEYVQESVAQSRVG